MADRDWVFNNAKERFAIVTFIERIEERLALLGKHSKPSDPVDRICIEGQIYSLTEKRDDLLKDLDIDTYA